jgi:hypothetical protein
LQQLSWQYRDDSLNSKMLRSAQHDGVVTLSEAKGLDVEFGIHSIAQVYEPR